uniref:Methyltransferase domain-containing protein n=1 Tax=Eucampia antarctica TaxID=49252 RepID=A0A7S2W9F6_9STRA|mmetsp:Transcript_23790/g.22828  ORF Transcript_23790/g.22828 Transcript_23790/m.22828 type:complete len:394 (+) Transcript_23790:51-1232(+)|eukprot:CAMPEP_0197832000 /NCGR_PEP_ID=MMETSP1437-20131217/12893_1 /TAXON_ID=49252 ORGANISM="Eucampia antarctica, Strain CCMP1452" /NCGR_SAMPLE_ID=MMETSP1437 /ASSEMBLY_ACC=CAM_ASM_001096 /LENGTH=393 /DNA_ID=CAMNT_0043435155 /DNA_START=50 /DNA_END=1231 /DNA_ORIENTATION=+
MMKSDNLQNTPVSMELEQAVQDIQDGTFVIGPMGRFDGHEEQEFNLEDPSFGQYDAKKRRSKILKYSAYTVCGLCFILLPWLVIFGKKTLDGNFQQQQQQSSAQPVIVCPGSDEIKPPKTVDYMKYYEDNNKENIDVSKFREWAYTDGIDDGYEKRKLHLSHWKVDMFSSSLKSGDMIYESATGLGTNLALTLELLSEHKGINNLQVYGNDMIESSVERAKELFTVNNFDGSTIGEFCVADSTHLFHVPSNSFHLAYSGYVDPLDNPLDFEKSGSEQKYDDLCDSAIKQHDDEHWQEPELARLAQDIQNDWYGLWVSELVRITKPGGTIAIEDIAPPYCQDRADWGGVTREWWIDANKRYDWGIETGSFFFADSDEALKGKRYHVVMTKQKAT